MAIRDLLAEYFIEQARWRDRKAEEYPEDDRNRRCAARLRDLAEYLRWLPSDDHRLATLEAIDLEAGTGSVTPGEKAAHLVSRYQFNRDDESPDYFLTRFTTACVEDAVDDSGEPAPWDD